MITKYNFPFINKFVHERVIVDFEKASSILIKKLNKLDINSINISDYNKNYLNNYLKSIRGHIQRYNYLLCLALSNTKKPYKDLILIDYGGGCGIMSFLAKEIGIGKVIYNDIYDISCDDVKVLSSHLHLPIDHIVHGGIDELISFSNQIDTSVDALVSYDVIEHIYDIYGFLGKLKYFSNPNFTFVLASGANSKNKKIVKSLQKHQIKLEFESRELSSSHKGRDSIKSYYEIRKQIIKSFNNNLTSKEVEALAHQTRGLMKEDIITYVTCYSSDNFEKRLPSDSNTCDPLTGNWAEHLLDFNKIIEITTKSFKVEIVPGYLPFSFLFVRRVKRNILNLIWSLIPRLGLKFSPFYIVKGRSLIKQNIQC